MYERTYGPILIAPTEFLPETEEERDAVFHVAKIGHIHIGGKVYACRSVVAGVAEDERRPE